MYKICLIRIVMYQHISIPLAIIIWELCKNRLPEVSGTTERYKRCLRLSMWPKNVTKYITKNRYNYYLFSSVVCDYMENLRHPL
jgi:hypothetical protein